MNSEGCSSTKRSRWRYPQPLQEQAPGMTCYTTTTRDVSFAKPPLLSETTTEEGRRSYSFSNADLSLVSSSDDELELVIISPVEDSPPEQAPIDEDINNIPSDEEVNQDKKIRRIYMCTVCFLLVCMIMIMTWTLVVEKSSGTTTTTSTTTTNQINDSDNMNGNPSQVLPFLPVEEDSQVSSSSTSSNLRPITSMNVAATNETSTIISSMTLNLTLP